MSRRHAKVALSRGGTKGILLIGGLGIGAYLLYKNTASAAQSAAALATSNAALPGLNTPVGPVSYLPATGLPAALPIQAGTTNIPELPAAGAVTASGVSNAQAFWNTLAPGQPITSGYVNFPSGTQAAATFFQIANDSYGSAYVQWAGAVYILTGPDVSGNYTATQVQTG